MTESYIHPIPFDDLKQGVLPLVAFGQNKRLHAIGTAFVVATMNLSKAALLLTARHNISFVQQIDSPHSRHHSTALPEFLPTPSNFVQLQKTGVHAILMLGSTAIIANMVRAWTFPGLDITAMLVEIPSHEEGTFPVKFDIDTRPIEAGTPVMAVGYPAMEAEHLDSPELVTNYRVNLTLPLQCRTGSVIRVCRKGEGIYSWPGYFVDFPFDSAMSGGPVIDLSANTPLVRGIVCGDMSENSYDQKRGSGLRAFVSTLWPAMLIDTHIPLRKRDGTNAPVNDTRLVDFIKHGLITDIGQAHLHIKQVEPSPDAESSWAWDH
jgi:hypothetical protein